MNRGKAEQMKRSTWLVAILALQGCSESAPDSGESTPSISYSQAVRCGQLARFFSSQDGIQYLAQGRASGDFDKSMNDVAAIAMEQAPRTLNAARNMALQKADAINPIPNPNSEIDNGYLNIVIEVRRAISSGDNLYIAQIATEFTGNCAAVI